uniref:Disease resistance protein At4g27190-like leucine-rich repeats domain-containing protein n=2 Tax=Hordeum vulgare subsp. vulgare TaxID=112509 RepID=A0A8I6XAV9_HORVV
MKKFDKIIHVDCSRWKSPRALQRTIAQELKLPQRVMDIFDMYDEEDDFKGVDEGSRAEILFIGKEIHQVLTVHRCLVIFHNGSSDMVNLSASGVLQGDFFYTKVLWTFRGRLRLNPGISDKVDDSHMFIYSNGIRYEWNLLLKEEAGEIAGYTNKLGKAVEECCLYLLSLNSQGGDIMDYDWDNHASSYWVCDGIIQGGQGDEAWELATALHQHINTGDYTFNTLPSFGHRLETPPRRWILSKDNSIVHPESTSFFLAAVASESDPPLRTLPNVMFHQPNKLRVLKLCCCTFSFSAPPFSCCHSLKFLGLDHCKDQQVEEDEKQDRPTMDFFHSLWVLDICHTDWELDLSANITEQMAANIREVHIRKGRIWCHNFSWRQLRKLHKLRVIEPTSPWQTGKMDEFSDMVKMEYLDLSGNSTIQVLPCLSGATRVKILVLDGCTGLEHVGPEGLPVSLESFSLDVCTRVDQNEQAKISCISLAGCGRLLKFILRGSLPNLEELDLSGTLVKTLDLKEVHAPNLQKIILLECLLLHAIIWPEKGLPTLAMLHIDSSVSPVQTKLHQTYVTIMDLRFFQSLVLQTNVRFCWKSTRFHLNLHVPCTTNVNGQSYMKEKMGPGNSGQIMGLPRPKSLAPNTYTTYIDVSVGNIIIDHDYNNGMQFQPSSCHVEIGKGISNAKVESEQVIRATMFAMDNIESLHVHDNSSIIIVIPEYMTSIDGRELGWRHLKQCHVVRCPKLHTVFTPNYDRIYPFEEIETFWASDLLNVHCIWNKGRTFSGTDNTSFSKLKSIHLYSCPRLTFVLPLLMGIQGSYLHNLGSLHIVKCGDLKVVFSVHPNLKLKEDVLEFPSLKHIHLYELYKLQHICEVKMHAPKLERVWLRGCWSLRRLPAVSRHSGPIVDCEKDWWEKLEWDGLEVGHHPSLFKPRHSSHYKKSLPRGSVLW